MSFLLFHIRRLLVLPYDLFFSPNSGVGTLWHESGRGRALLLGLPAVLCAVFGVLFLCIAKYGLAGSLEDRYKNDAETSAKNKTELIAELRQEARMKQATQRTESGAANSKRLASEFIDKDDPRRGDLKIWQEKQEVFLEKLIDLNPQQADYRFDLSMLSFEKGDINRGLALLKMIAPIGEPGHIKSHLWLANYYMQSPADNRSDALKNIDMAITHANQCLKREQDNMPAKRLKARLLLAKREYNDAHSLFLDLFESEPRYFKSLVELNNRRGKPEQNEEILDQAVIRLQQMLNDPELNERERARIWADLANCYRHKKEYVEIERLLLEQLQASEAGDGQRVWVESLLSNVYLNWVGKVSSEEPDEIRKRLELLKKAYQFDPTNSVVLREFVRIGNSDVDADAALEARKIYDPSKHPDAPDLVLNELGAQALARSEYELALQYFSMARDKSPKNPEILNNISYAYLAGDNPNPKRALKLIDEAIRYLPMTDGFKKYLSYFRDTRGRALMQLNDFPAAIKEFEFALLDRPDNIGILEALAECYEASDMDASPYRRRIEEVKQTNPTDK